MISCPPDLKAPIMEVLEELRKSAAKFPEWPDDPIHAAGVVNEECGELQREVLKLCYEPHKSTRESVRVEAVQTAVMAIRFLHSLDHYVFQPGPQHKQDFGLPAAKPAVSPEAINALQDLIKKQHRDLPDVSVAVITDDGGRISEISVSYPVQGGKDQAGFSIMACEPACFAVLFAAERYLLHYGEQPYRPEGWESGIDLAAEAEENFLYLYNKK